MEKILTITVPTYNMEAYLDECLSSMVMEDASLMEALEVIVVNDGSKDNSLNIALSYKERYPNTFVVIDKENGNYGSCVNRGLQVATGRYFRIVDADDWVDTKALEELVVRLGECECDLVFTHYIEWFDSHKKLVKISSDIVSDIACNTSDFIYNENDFHLQMHGMTYKTNLLIQSSLSLSEGVSYTDIEYCFYPLLYIKNFIFYDIVLYQYRAQREGQTMSVSSMINSTRSISVILKRMILSLSHDCEENNTNKQMRDQVLMRAVWFYYWVSLTLCKKTSAIESDLRDIHSIVLSVPRCASWPRRFNKHRIKYVAVWEKTGLYNSSLIFKIYNIIYEVLLRVYHLFKK